MRKSILLILTIFFFSCNKQNQKEHFLLMKGDILFQDLDSSPLCDAIELVTPGYRNGNFSHIGIVVELGYPDSIGADYIYENNIRILDVVFIN